MNRYELTFRVSFEAVDLDEAWRRAKWFIRPFAERKKTPSNQRDGELVISGFKVGLEQVSKDGEAK